MRISNIVVKNYRNLEDIDIAIGDIVAIIGNNNSGKSNLLKAVTLPFLADEIGYIGKHLSWFDINNNAKDRYYSFLLENKSNLVSNITTLEEFEQYIPTVYIEIEIKPEETELYYVRDLACEIDEKDIRFRLYYEFSPKSNMEVFDFVKRILVMEDIDNDTISHLKMNLLPIELYKYSVGVPGKGSVSYDVLKQFKYTSLVAERDEFSKTSEKLGSKSLVRLLQGKLTDDNRVTIEKAYSHFFETLKSTARIDDIINWQEYSELKNAKTFFEKINVLPNMPTMSSILNSVKLGYNEENLSLQGLGQRNLILLMVLINSLLEKDEQIAFNLLTVEEPEAHLCINNVRLVSSFIKAFTVDNKTVQMFYSTHNTEFINKLNLSDVVLMNGGRAYSLTSEFNDEEKDYLSKTPNLDLFKLFYSKKCILVEGLTEELLIRAYMDSRKELSDIEVISFHKGFIKIIELWLKLNSGNGNRLGIVRDYDEEPNAQTRHEAYNIYPNVCVRTTNEKTLEPEIVKTGQNYEALKSRYGEELGWKNMSPDEMSDDWRCKKSYAMLRICKDISCGAFPEFQMPSHIQSVIDFMIMEEE